MPPTRIISRPAVFDFARQLITSARSTIKTTMDAEEELKNPLPPTYLDILQRKAGAGVRIFRIGFGKESLFKTSLKRVHIKNPNYSFRFTSGTGYIRLLCIDDTKLLFADGGLKGEISYSEDPAILNKYGAYFGTTFNAAKQLGNL